MGMNESESLSLEILAGGGALHSIREPPEDEEAASASPGNATRGRLEWLAVWLLVRLIVGCLLRGR